jgi:hypothetical protein
MGTFRCYLGVLHAGRAAGVCCPDYMVKDIFHNFSQLVLPLLIGDRWLQD